MPQFLLTPDLKVASGKWGEYTKAVSCLLSPVSCLLTPYPTVNFTFVQLLIALS
ncbi:hypothetical protein [Microcystis sp. M_OC_Ca_00000000_S217Cul]|uniref:hypothetical protein n=1 Tax=Microcystis sp. M_OC_Ca_00000000_S217Cul TaxID=2486214 RepID=UPI002580B6A3|nr:hypothetical protein [Microcystis sp. M_OC_Ca_00000000_S217Cul]